MYKIECKELSATVYRPCMVTSLHTYNVQNLFFKTDTYRNHENKLHRKTNYNTEQSQQWELVLRVLGYVYQAKIVYLNLSDALKNVLGFHT